MCRIAEAAGKLKVFHCPERYVAGNGVWLDGPAGVMAATDGRALAVQEVQGLPPTLRVRLPCDVSRFASLLDGCGDMAVEGGFCWLREGGLHVRLRASDRFPDYRKVLYETADLPDVGTLTPEDVRSLRAVAGVVGVPTTRILAHPEGARAWADDGGDGQRASASLALRSPERVLGSVASRHLLSALRRGCRRVRMGGGNALVLESAAPAAFRVVLSTNCN